MIRTVTGDVETINGRILAHEHLQIDLSAQKGPANKVGAGEEDAVVEDLVAAKGYGLAAITDLSAPRWGRDPAALRRDQRARRGEGRVRRRLLLGPVSRHCARKARSRKSATP